MMSIRTRLTVVMLAAVCSACGSLIPVAKVSAPPSVSDSDLKKADADCKKSTTSDTSKSGTATTANCKPQTKP